jgi:DNA-binding NarL/FixJ family response regulator
MGTGNYSTVLIAAGEGRLRDALRAMMISMPGVSILEAGDTPEAETFLREQHPALVVIDCALPGNHTMQLVRMIQQLKPRARCFILVDNVLQQAAALRAGADEAPLKGEPAVRLFAQVEQLLSQCPGRLAA